MENELGDATGSTRVLLIKRLKSKRKAARKRSEARKASRHSRANRRRRPILIRDLAIELLHVSEVAKFLGHEQDGAYEVRTDSKAAYDLYHRG